MSDPMTNVEIEDVLSSIRRLVSEDLRSTNPTPVQPVRGAADAGSARPAPAQPDSAAPAPAAPVAKLVLTPALRVAEPEPDAADGPADSHPPAELAGAAPDVTADRNGPGPGQVGADDADQDRDADPLASDAWIAGATAAPWVRGVPGDRLAGLHPAAVRTLWAADALADAAELVQGGAESGAPDADSADTGQQAADEPAIAATLESTIARLEAAVAGIDGEFEGDDAAHAPDAGHPQEFEDRPDPGGATADFAVDADQPDAADPWPGQTDAATGAARPALTRAGQRFVSDPDRAERDRGSAAGITGDPDPDDLSAPIAGSAMDGWTPAPADPWPLADDTHADDAPEGGQDPISLEDGGLLGPDWAASRLPGAVWPDDDPADLAASFMDDEAVEDDEAGALPDWSDAEDVPVPGDDSTVPVVQPVFGSRRVLRSAGDEAQAVSPGTLSGDTGNADLMTVAMFVASRAVTAPADAARSPRIIRPASAKDVGVAASEGFAAAEGSLLDGSWTDTGEVAHADGNADARSGHATGDMVADAAADQRRLTVQSGSDGIAQDEAGPARTPVEELAGSGAGAAPDPDLTDDELFDPADDIVIDADALRDMVTAIIREELQGPLGERITRNVRKLVRREIARALESRVLE